MRLDSLLVLDTNTVLALWMFGDPGLAGLAAHVAGGHCILLTRPDALEELAQVLAYRQFKQPPETQEAILEHYRSITQRVAEPSPTPSPLPACRDRDDQKFLEIARDGKATALLTRDKALLRLARHRLVREHFAILTPEAWQTTLGQ